MIAKPSRQGEVLAVGGGEVGGCRCQPLWEMVLGHGLFPGVTEGVDEGPEGVSLGDVVGVMTDLPSRVLWGGDVQVARTF
jgi:hypothetical protein